MENSKTEIPYKLKKLDHIITCPKVYQPRKNIIYRYEQELSPKLSSKPSIMFNMESEKEKTIEETIGAKHRINNRDQMKNLLTSSAEGSKPYRHPEYSPDFFKIGGLVVGSTNKINHKKNSNIKDNNFYASLDLTKKTLNPQKLWKNKVLQDSFEFDNKYVNELSSWDKNVLKDYIPKKNKQNDLKGKQTTAKKK